ncbi:hypothetical protein E2E30_08465 [Sphingomonas sp. AAP5]|uniref:hypothetical protein n=1 Tax=Sphingomonas sp. AAP5 TaxID=1523415 RepID=UPI001057192B|nr:hypothetical protein [Sphingomonas sp. AAP5]QBM75802.1 hypothetical protein E2E30_08465 [Sphingomonas sp. AAP5]
MVQTRAAGSFPTEVDRRLGKSVFLAAPRRWRSNDAGQPGPFRQLEECDPDGYPFDEQRICFPLPMPSQHAIGWFVELHLRPDDIKKVPFALT